ncbi:hypothetical protein HPB47_014522, partial [Ixodes persulcatus]
ARKAQRVSQLERLTKSATGRHILASLGIRYESQTGEMSDVLGGSGKPSSYQTSQSTCTRRITRNAERRDIAEGVLYTDAARAGGGAMVATAVNQQGDVISSCSIKTSEPEVTEEVAIALAIRVRGARIVVSDSQQAIRQFAKGRISTAALKVLGDPEKMSTRVQLIWTPAHSSAHGAARELAHRAGEPLNPSHWRETTLSTRAPIAGQEDTGSFPSPSLLNKWYPDKYKPNCKLCGGHANLRHMVWECSRMDRKSHPLLEKNQLVQLAEDAAKTQRVQAAV